ncbi:MAG: uroporphyrinogen decarboxylase family protein [Spirochaetota bacterium]
MEWLRDEYLDYMAGRRVDRPMFVELFGPLVGLEDEWRAQGASEDEIALTAFGFDYVRRTSIEVAHGYWPPLPEEVLEDDEAYRVVRDRMGRRMKLSKGKATIALPLDFPVATEADWARVKPRYAFDEARFAEGWADRARRAREDGALVVTGIVGGYDEIRELMGDEEACVSFYTQPELIRDMLETFRALNHEILSRVVAEVPVDQLSVHEDYAGKSGPLVGPNIMDEFIGPYYAAAWEEVAATPGGVATEPGGATPGHRAPGARAELFQLDSDGNITPIVDSLLAAGVNSILPNEPAAGMDMVALRERYGSRLKLVGGIDKFAPRTSREAIDRELASKLQPKMREGGVVFGLDHRIPNGTPIELYRYYVRRAREMLGLDPNPEPGWGRMAF